MESQFLCVFVVVERNICVITALLRICFTGLCTDNGSLDVGGVGMYGNITSLDYREKISIVYWNDPTCGKMRVTSCAECTISFDQILLPMCNALLFFDATDEEWSGCIPALETG